jgi:hypothetical protein
MRPLLSVVDHLVYATLDVEATLRDLGASMGVSAAAGGQHPSWGTRNALLALGPRMYLEIVGPDPSLPRPAGKRPFGLDTLSAPRLATWACRGEDLPGIVEAAGRLGVGLGDVRPGSRKRPDGSALSWTMTDLMSGREDGIVPFFIDWGVSPHPAEGAPQGCALLGLRGRHPDAKRIRSILEALDLDLPVVPGERPALQAVISTPLGAVELG